MQARPGVSETCHLTPPDQLFLPRLKRGFWCQHLLVKPQEQAQNHLQSHTWLREHTLIRNGPAMHGVASQLNPRSPMSPGTREDGGFKPTCRIARCVLPLNTGIQS